MFLKRKCHIIFILGTIFFFRMFSIFSMLPTNGVYEIFSQISSKKIIGISTGIYGLTQAILQIPFGLLSDYIDRRFVIILGLLTFSIGSVVGIYINNIYGIIICRFLQGLGAISSVIITLFSDFSKRENYKISMFFIGIIIGLSFLFAIVLVPIILQKTGLNGLFTIITILNLTSILLVLFIPNYKRKYRKIKFYVLTKQVINILGRKNLLTINYSIFFLHAILVSIFFVLPSIMINIGLPILYHWKIYLIIILLSYFISIIVIFLSKYKTNLIFFYNLIFLLLSELIFLFFINNLYLVFIGIQIFFSVFNIMETLLPISIRNKLEKNHIGLGMGIYSTNQFLGSAFGGLMSGYLYQTYGIQSVFLYCLLTTIIWLSIFFLQKKSLIL